MFAPIRLRVATISLQQPSLETDIGMLTIAMFLNGGRWSYISSDITIFRVSRGKVTISRDQSIAFSSTRLKALFRYEDSAW